MKINFNSWVHLSDWSFFQNSVMLPRKCNKGDDICHDHDFYEIVCIENGSIPHAINNQQLDLKAGDILFVRPHDKHLYLREPDNTCTHYDVLYKPTFFEETCEFLDKNFLTYYHQPVLPIKAHVSQEKIKDIIKRLKSYDAIPLNEKERKTITAKFILIEFMDYFWSEFSPSLQYEKKESNSQDWLDAFLALLSNPKLFHSSLNEIISSLNYNSSYISRAFKKRMNMTITEYFNDQKLLYAASALTYTTLPIIDIAMDSGFISVSHFNKLFKQKYNCTPTQFRANAQTKTLHIKTK